MWIPSLTELLRNTFSAFSLVWSCSVSWMLSSVGPESETTEWLLDRQGCFLNKDCVLCDYLKENSESKQGCYILSVLNSGTIHTSFPIIFLCPHSRKDLETMEKVQRRAVRVIRELGGGGKAVWLSKGN